MAIMRQSLDQLEQRIAAALLAAPRASWRTIADCLDLSERTVLRRAAPLYGDGTLRATAVRNPLYFPELTPVALRIRCRPSTIGAVARTLAHRPDTVWVEILGGGEEISVVLFLANAASRNGLLLRDLPATAAVTSWSTQQLIRVFPTAFAWTGGLLTETELAQLRPPTEPAKPAAPQPVDAALIEALTADARASYGAIAARAGIGATTARRRIAAILDGQMIRLATELDLALLGIKTDALLWLTVPPAELERTGSTLSAHPQVRFAAATTGTSNLFIAVAAADRTGLYEFLTATLGPLTGDSAVETHPILSTVKRTGLIR